VLANTVTRETSQTNSLIIEIEIEIDARSESESEPEPEQRSATNNFVSDLMIYLFSDSHELLEKFDNQYYLTVYIEFVVIKHNELRAFLSNVRSSLSNYLNI